MAFRTRTVYSYDYATNRVVPSKLQSRQIADYGSNSGADTDARFGEILLNGIYVCRQPYWNEQMNVYDDVVKQLFESNALVINAVGYTTRQPSDLVQVDIQMDEADWSSEQQSQYDDWKTRYRELSGPWFVAQVRHTVEPAEQRYRQNLVLFRNFFLPPVK